VKHIVVCTLELDKPDFEQNLLTLVWHLVLEYEEKKKKVPVHSTVLMVMSWTCLQHFHFHFHFQDKVILMHYLSGLKRIAHQEHQDNARREIVVADALAVGTCKLDHSRMGRGTI
jgi:hypothetical protein